MPVSAIVIEDSVNVAGNRLTTLQLRYPRFIHADMMTHRAFSRNASSSRATPVKTLIQDVMDDPAMPLVWNRNKPGMQGGEEWDNPVQIPEYDNEYACYHHTPYTKEQSWLEARDQAIRIAQAFADADFHKQIVNRLLEPFCHINVVCTSSTWTNFLALRNHPDAQPEIKILAQAIEDALNSSYAEDLEDGDWHLPYVDFSDTSAVCKAYGIDYRTDWDTVAMYLAKISAARCARVSYLTHDKKTPTIEQDLALYDRLVGSSPIHASPTEHQAMADPEGKHKNNWGNFDGFVQYRKTIPNENITSYKDFL